MQIVPVESYRLTILMVAGALFATAGILLMFRAKQEGSSARLELLGQKFEASSTGIVVFVMGVALLASPIFIPERIPPPGLSRVDPVDDGQPVGLPGGTVAKEMEPNDGIRSANAISVGQTIAGGGENELDWYVFDVDDTQGDQLSVTLRVLEGACSTFVLLNSTENNVGSAQVCPFEVSSTRSYPVSSGRYYVRIETNSGRTKYELVLRYMS